MNFNINRKRSLRSKTTKNKTKTKKNTKKVNKNVMRGGSEDPLLVKIEQAAKNLPQTPRTPKNLGPTGLKVSPGNLGSNKLRTIITNGPPKKLPSYQAPKKLPSGPPKHI